MTQLQEQTEVDEKAVKKAKFIANLSFIVLGIALAFIMTLAYWNFQDDTIFAPEGNNHIKIIDKEALAGSTVTVSLTYCKVIDEPVQFTRSFVTESTVINNPTLVDDTGKGCIEERIVEVPVPPQAASGDYRLRYAIEAQINPLKKAKQEFYSNNTVHVIGLVDQKLGQ